MVDMMTCGYKDCEHQIVDGNASEMWEHVIDEHSDQLEKLWHMGRVTN